MKFFFIFISFFVFTGSLCAQQQYYRIELLKEGQAILQTTPVSGSDISWWMSLKGKDCVVRDAFANFDLWNSRVNLQLHVDLADFSRFCGSYSVGDSVHVWVEVTNPNHVLYGYAGENTYAVLQKEYSEDFLGANGINLRPRPRIRVEDKEACGRNGDVITAIVTHAPKGYFVDWVDPRLEPSGSDQARIIGFPGDTVLSLSAILRDKDGKGLDTAYYKLKLKPLPEVEVTPSYRFCSQGEEYTFSGHFADGNDYHWVHRSYALSATSRKTVVFPEIMEDRDVRYELFVTDRTTGCRNSDTAWVYRRPDVPLIDIDTNTMRTDIALKLTDTLEMDSIRIYSIAWDAYNLRGEGYRERALLKSTGEMQSWVETDLQDTLRFYYAKAYRNIPGVGIIESAGSDTVGYFRQFLLGKNEGKGAFNLFSCLFNMSVNGIVTDRDLQTKLFDVRLGKEACEMQTFDEANQRWIVDTYYSDWDWWDGTPWDLTEGDAFFTIVSEKFDKTEFLTYGKLSPKVSYHFITGPKGSDNIACLPLHHADLRTTGEIVEHLGHEVTVSYWDFSLQKFVSTFYNPGDPASGIAPSMVGSIPVYPGMPLMINVQKPLDWK